MYIVIFEENEPKQTETMDQATLDAADDGLAYIIDIDTMSLYGDGAWSPLNKWDVSTT